jgi:hypothetical protein
MEPNGSATQAKRGKAMDTNTEKQVLTGREFCERFISLFNQTHGSEWNSRAGGFVAAKLWDKKQSDGELRVYFGSIKDPLVMKSRSDGRCGFTQVPSKYGIDEKIKSTFAAVAEAYTTGTGIGGVLMQEDEDGIIAPAGQHEPGVHIVREWYK